MYKAFPFILALGDITIFYISIPIALFVRHLQFPDLNFLFLHLLYFSPIILLWIIIFFISGLYNNLIILFKQKHVETLFLVQFINTIIALLIFFVVLDSNISPRFTMLIYLIISLILLYIWRTKIFLHLFAPKTIFLNVNKKTNLINKLINELDNSLLFKIKIIDNTISNKELSNSRSNSVVQFELIDDLEEINFERLYYSIKNSKNFIYLSDLLDLSGKFLIDYKNSFLSYRLNAAFKNEKNVYNFFKRIFDVLFAISFLPIALPVALLVATLVYIESGTPVIYKSKRRGIHGKDFMLYKFRTMTGTDTGKEAKNSKLSVTRLGRFLRALRLDELPQLINIIKGDMSFVGPRPEISEIADEYEKHIPLYFLRYLAKPGLTGWAQVSYENDPHHFIDVQASKGKLEYDLFYVFKRSIIFDIGILFQTILIVLKLKGK